MLFAYALALLVGTHAPYPFRTETEIAGITLDKFVHGLIFAPLALLVAGFLAQRRSDSPWRRGRLWIMPAVLLIAAGLDEYTQAWVGRSRSLADFIGDAAGILLVALAVTVAAVVSRLRPDESGLRRGEGPGPPIGALRP